MSEVAAASVQRGDEFSLHLEGLAVEGRSIARVNGLVVFVRGGVPGDDVRVRVTKTKKQFVEADIVEILSPSLMRVQPRCKVFGTCGGCTWQDLSYEAQLEFKRSNVVDALERIGKFSRPDVRPTLEAVENFFYRNKMEFSFGDRWLTDAELSRHSSGEEIDRFALGLHVPQRYDRIVDVDECWLQSATSNRIVNTVRDFCRRKGLDIYSTRTHEGYLRNLVIRESKKLNEIMVNLVTRDDNPTVMDELTRVLLSQIPEITTVVNNITDRKSQVAIGDREKVYHGPGYITEKIGKRSYRISANSFFQTNTLQAERLYDVVLNLAALRKDDVVFDLYSGTGTIALHVADEARAVVGIESVAVAVEDAKKNAIDNGVPNCTFLLGDLKDRLTKENSWLEELGRPSIIIADPPRSGMQEKVVREIETLRPHRVVYVSCNPATQARDLQMLCSAGRYCITGIQPVDMFPHTYHIENVVTLEAVA